MFSSVDVDVEVSARLKLLHMHVRGTLKKTEKVKLEDDRICTLFHWTTHCGISSEVPSNGKSNEMPQCTCQWKEIGLENKMTP